jgi:GNAT superfamily N-acetyltransferase
MTPVNLEYKGYHFTTDKERLQPEAIHAWLSENAYWCKHIPFDVVKSAFDNSYTLGILKDGKQIAYARFITDYAVFAHLADVYVEASHRGKGLSKKMMDILMEQDWVKNLRSITLGTLDAHELYRKYGFSELQYPDRRMEIQRPLIYGDSQNRCK